MSDWPILESAYIPALRDSLGVGAGWRTPHELAEKSPFVRVESVGTDDGITFEGLVDFECFDTSLPEAHDLARTVREWVLGTHNRIVSGVQVDNVTTASGPQRVHWSDNVQRVIYSARIRARRQ